MAVDTISVIATSRPKVCNQSASGLANTASPTIPLNTPIDVMPICTVDKNLVGSSDNLSATAADLSPSAANFTKRAFLAVTRAISDMANKPLVTIRPIRISTSTSTLLFSRAKQGCQAQGLKEHCQAGRTWENDAQRAL
ncbi:hypothetical protein BMETH_284_2 [methanotrophic bacterial endosymbiont of Bathymodiolus sp.]|nr:hypothetical protein BMETH_284_2 [methanotrophic bacterial endosymbiont of Bathymodiolus sp.]